MNRPDIAILCLKEEPLASPLQSLRLARFGGFSLDLRAGELRTGTERIRLQDKPFQMLRLLLEHSGEVVTREELQKTLWPGGTVVEFDHGIATALKKLRQALGDDADHPRYIETLARRGYRWIAGVEWVESAEKPEISKPPDEKIDSIAVLPFANLDGDPEQDYFCEGLAEEILTALTLIPGLRVTARTSSFAFRGKKQDIRQIGQALNVRSILEGSVRHSGNRIRITVQLIHAGSGYHLWSETYDREMTGVFAVQEEIAQAIARLLKVKLGAPPAVPLPRRGTENPDAHRAYLEGRHHMMQLTASSMARALACYQRAIALDPNYANAYAGLAEHHYYLAFYSQARPREVLPAALDAAERALEIDLCCAAAYSIRGALRAVYRYDWTGAGEDLSRALELNPSDAHAHHRRAACYLRPLGRLEESLAEIKRSIELDPLWAFARGLEPVALLMHGEKSQAVERAREVIELFPWYWLSYLGAARVLGASGFREEALSALRKGLAADPENAYLLAALALSHGRRGEGAEALRMRRQLEETARTRYISPCALAITAMSCGDVEQTYDWLHKGVDEHDPMIIARSQKAPFPGHEQDTRFHALRRRMNLDPVQSFPQR
jgi:TolB-like protein/Tfp pilus assembly protein PilF